MASKRVRKLQRIAEAYQAGFNLGEIKELLGSRITLGDLDEALEWQRRQALVRSEIQSLYNALLSTRALLKRAMHKFNSIVSDDNVRVSDIQRLINAELEYSNEIRRLAEQIDVVSGHADIASLPAGVFSEDIEPKAIEGDS